MATETLVSTTRSTGNVNTERLVRDVANRIALLDPSAAPLTTVLVRAERRSRKVTNPKFEMLELRRPSETTTTDGTAGSTTTATTIPVTNEAYFAANDVITNVTSGEVMLVVSVATGLLTVVRAIGGDIGAVASGAVILRIGNAQAEGSTKPDLLSRNVEIPFNYIQIQRRNWALTQTAQDTANYGEKDQKTRNRENSIEHAVDLEKQLLWGKRDIRASGTFPQRLSGGVFWYLDQAGSGAAISASVGTLTLSAIDTWAEDLFKYDSSPKMCFCGDRAMSAFTVIARNGGQINLKPEDTAFGLRIRRFITAHGELMLVKHNIMSRIAGYTGLALALTMKRLKLAYQGGQRTKLWRDQQTNDADSREDGLRSATSLELVLPEQHGYLDGITGGS